jgi:hypothetical protein
MVAMGWVGLSNISGFRCDELLVGPAFVISLSNFLPSGLRLGADAHDPNLLPPSLGHLPTALLANSWRCIIEWRPRLRARFLRQTRPVVFFFCREQLLPAERALVQVHRRTADEQGFFIALDRYLCPNRAAQTCSGVRAGEPCPLRQPLVESEEPTLFVHAAKCSGGLAQRQVTRSDTL